MLVRPRLVPLRVLWARLLRRRGMPQPASSAAAPSVSFPSGKTASPDRPRRAVRSPIAITPPYCLGLTAALRVGRPDGHERVAPVLVLAAHQDGGRDQPLPSSS